MAMTAAGMAEAIIAGMEAGYRPLTDEERGPSVEYYQIITKAIIDYIVANAEVLPGTFANSAGSVTGIGKIT